MNYQKLLEMQAELDNHIITKHNLKFIELPKLVLAAITELSEVCNDSQCFKYWKVNSKPKPGLSEEVADFTHFLASLSNRFQVVGKDIEERGAIKYTDISEQFLHMHYTASMIGIFPSAIEKQKHVLILWSLFKGLLDHLNFTEEQLFEAYLKKNEKNYERQATGY